MPHAPLDPHTLKERGGNAANACAEYIKGRYVPCKVLILCGKGNNSADGLVLASLISDRFAVTVYQPILGKPGSPCAEFRKEAVDKGITFTMVAEPEKFELIIDAYYGIGFHLPLDENTARLFRRVNESAVPVIALDMPSGVESDTGRCDEHAIIAERTLTFTRNKIGLFVYPGADHAGTVVLLDAGIPVPEGISYRYTSISDLSLYPKRVNNSHKGTYGSLCIFAGTTGMAGAAYLCAHAAYRTGVGLVKIVTPEENRIILQTMLPEAVLVCYDTKRTNFRHIENAVTDCHALVAGPGIGKEEFTEQILTMLLASFEDKSTIIDADALNILSKNIDLLPRGAVVTPHPKEFARLSQADVSQVIACPFTNALSFAQEHSIVTLLKGARTVIGAPDGSARINLTGNNGMATAGSGDVLSGIIGALLALGVNSFDSASLGAYIHGKAGDIAAEKIGKPSMMASDIVGAISEVLKKS